MIKFPYNLDESEMALLDAFVKGPGLAVLSKIVKIEVEKIRAMLETENSVDVMRQLQGRITGTRAILAIPVALVNSKLRENPQS